MESGIQSSFIPHDAGEVKMSSPRLGGNGFADLLLLLSIVLLVASGALAGGVFLYKEYLQRATTSKVDQLQRAKAAFEPALIQKLTRLDDRMHAAATILGNHIAPSVLFSALEKATLTTVSFRSLDFTDSDNQHINIKMAGVAESVNSIALQAQLFSKNGIITSPIFSNIGRDSDGVNFSVTALVNPTTINYVQSLGGQPQSGASQGSQQPQTQTPRAPASPFGGTAPAAPTQ